MMSQDIINEAFNVLNYMPNNGPIKLKNILNKCKRPLNMTPEMLSLRIQILMDKNLIRRVRRGYYQKIVNGDQVKIEYDDVTEVNHNEHKRPYSLTPVSLEELVAEIKLRGNYKVIYTKVEEVEL